jgi:hypothetical protein
MSLYLPVSLVVENPTFPSLSSPPPDIISRVFFQYKREEIILDLGGDLGYKTHARSLDIKGV